jgi:hypothetical protein
MNLKTNLNRKAMDIILHREIKIGQLKKKISKNSKMKRGKIQKIKKIKKSKYFFYPNSSLQYIN